MHGAQANILPDGRRLHLHHGPIDLIIGVTGPGRDNAYQRAKARFEAVLTELVTELPELRSPGRSDRRFSGPIARRMQTAIAPYCSQFVTPMAAVAGAVADDILQHICSGGGIHKAYVNNGGDIAFYITPGHHMTIALASVPSGQARMQAEDEFRGIATSGWRGRSFSLGIADSVTVVARDAASADVAATLIANSVDLPDCPNIKRTPAKEVSPDSDLGDQLVTTDVNGLSDEQIERALSRGAIFARSLYENNLIGAACLQLGEEVRAIGSFAKDQHLIEHAPFHTNRSVLDARL